MPIIQSARKRVKVSTKARSRNNRTKRNLRDAIKAFSAALSDGKTAQIAKTEREVISAIDIAAKKHVVHRNKAARQKAQIAAKAKAAGVKPSKSEPKKATTAKKVPAKKPATVKKSPAKK